MVATINIYYQKVIELVLDLYHDEFSSATAGHCMKITGFGKNELEYLWELLDKKYADLDTYIVSTDPEAATRYISATKLIELRNKQDKPLLILIPSNSRTAAEDSYGNATFKEISLEGIEQKLKGRLISELPSECKKDIEDILNYLSSYNISLPNTISYLISLHEDGFTKENIGNYLFYLQLLPDEALLSDKEKTRSRLNFNLVSTELISSFNKPLYDRIADLPLEPNTLQKEIVDFIKAEKDVKSTDSICRIIFEKYPSLNFSKWPIPDLDFTHIKLFAEQIKSNDFQTEEGTKVLHAERNRVSKVRVRFSTQPAPKDIADLKYFKIILMAVDGGNGEEIRVLRKLKNTNSNYPYREATVELDSNMIEEGSYFFKVLAEDEHGNILNANDDFKDFKIQKAWEEALEKDEKADKSSFDFKLTCDSEDFDYIVEDEVEKPENQRKDKLHNVLQAYFKYRIDLFKSDEEAGNPVPSENSNVWLNDDKQKLTSTYHINYSEKHNYQINLSTKLRLIESEFLNHGSEFGYIDGTLNNNSASVGFRSLVFKGSELTSMIPQNILKLRKSIFDQIQQSNEKGNGVFESAGIFNFINEIKEYVKRFSEWTGELKNQISSENLETDEKVKLQHFLTALQILDVAKIRTKLPDGKSVEALLLSPLHPLRLAWFTQLFEVFENWEKRTREYANYKEAWTKNLEYLFDGILTPENNPLVLVEPGTFKSFHYSGELAYGWGLYLNASSEQSNETLTSINRQLMHYFRTLFNITKENYVETDISQRLIVRHIKNYLLQHPYTDKLIINLINAGDASVFADAFVELERDSYLEDIKYEIRIFRGDDKIIEHGEALKNLINPEFNVSEEAEAFSQPSKNRLFPKLRFSINSILDYLQTPTKYTSHISFLISPFPVRIELIKPYVQLNNFYLNGIITDPSVVVEETGSEVKWNRFVLPNNLHIKYSDTGQAGINLFNHIQSFIAGALASKYTEALPATQLVLNEKDKVLLNHLHDYSDWVVTFDRNLGAQIFDQPSKDGRIPFLLDYVPGEEVSGISSFLTTRPTSEILGLLWPHFKEFNLDIHSAEDEKKIKILLEDLRAVSSSLVLQLNSSRNKAFEVIGSAFTKRVLEKKGFLKESFLIPIDLHQNLFDGLSSESKSRADNLLVSINPERSEISITVIEIKCRQSLGEAEKDELKVKMQEQIENTIEAIQTHFDPEYHVSFDRLDREIKNKELKSLLTFYIERAYRYEFLTENAYSTYIDFLQTLDKGFSFKFNQLGLIFDFAATQRHHKEVIDSNLTYFTFGGKLIDDILDPDSDLNTRRLENEDLDNELGEIIGADVVLKPFIQKFQPKRNESPNTPTSKKDSLDAKIKKQKTPVSKETTSSDKEVNETAKKATVIPSKQESKANKDHNVPDYDILLGKNSPSLQYGILGKSIHGKKIAVDLSETNTISLFGVQGGGKSYTIGTVSEMVLKQFNNINELPSPLAGVIFHYSESMDYEPEFTSMIYPNDKSSELQKLRDEYGADPDNIEDVVILTPKDKMEERQREFPSIQVLPIAFNSKELNVQDWMFLLGAVGNDSAYIKQLKAIMKDHRRNITLDGITESVESSDLLSNSQKSLARQKLSFAREYIDDEFYLRDALQPERLVIVDLRDEFIVKDEALGLFVIMLNIFSGVREYKGKHFNKFIVFDEAHKYMDNKDLTGNIVTAIREMRHKGVSIMIASQDPPSLPNEIIELSSIVLIHKFNSPQWLKHIQRSITQLNTLSAADMSALAPGEGFLWATKATDKSVSAKPIKISTRPRVTKHGGGTIQANGNQ